MRRAFFALVLVAACDSSPAPTPAASAAPSGAVAPSSTQPAPGPITLERLTKARELIQEGDDWKAASAKLTAALGPATHEGYERAVWGASTADDCTYLMVKTSSNKVSSIGAAGTYPRAKTSEFEDCYVYLDRTPPDKDASAAGPISGKFYTVREVMDGLNNAHSKWILQTIRLRGRSVSVVRSGPTNNWTHASMTIVDEKDDSIKMGVQFEDDDVKAAPQDGQKVVITAEGTLSTMGRSLEKAHIVK
jgi:hypothetical protein